MKQTTKVSARARSIGQSQLTQLKSDHGRLPSDSTSNQVVKQEDAISSKSLTAVSRLLDWNELGIINGERITPFSIC